MFHKIGIMQYFKHFNSHKSAFLNNLKLFILEKISETLITFSRNINYKYLPKRIIYQVLRWKEVISGWRTKMGGNQCNVPVCHANQCGDGICHSPMMCKCPDGSIQKSCNKEEEIFEVKNMLIRMNFILCYISFETHIHVFFVSASKLLLNWLSVAISDINISKIIKSWSYVNPKCAILE